MFKLRSKRKRELHLVVVNPSNDRKFLKTSISSNDDLNSQSAASTDLNLDIKSRTPSEIDLKSSGKISYL